MNIKEAKTQIKNAITAYFTKDESGEYIVPIEKQRPVFLMGPPGIGKTAIMEQIASEMNVGLLSYSMTHHTRQSALGLPFIEHKKYKDIECDISEYTMSEIIASIYDLMEETGISEGILFLDEINCVSETLAPVMLQFLQYKVFGRHRVPDGWIVVTAGNPPEYNNSVREFDIVTWDRLKRVDVEPDYNSWKEYAYQKGLHASVTTYLEIKKGDFYTVESTVDGKSFVTARGWDDLSQMIKLYELNNIKVDRTLISQYIQNNRIAKDFAIYYDLFLKYQSDYQIDKILDNKETSEIEERAKNAKFDERLSLIGMLIDGLSSELKPIMDTTNNSKELISSLAQFKNLATHNGKLPVENLNDIIEQKRKQLVAGKKSASLSREEQSQIKALIQTLEDEYALIANTTDGMEAFNIIKEDYNARLKKLQSSAKAGSKRIGNAINFCEKVFPNSQEMVILITEITANPHISRFISRYGCDEYFTHNKDLLIHTRQQEILNGIKDLELN